MRPSNRPIRVLYSFPHKLGADRICYTAWQQVNGLAAAGADVLVFPGALSRPVPAGVTARPTLAKGKLRIPYKVLGSSRAFALHDYIVSRRIEKMAGQIDIIHTWPLGARETLKVASRLGIPTALERPNANTRFAMEVVQQECDRMGIALPSGHEHAYNAETLRIEKEEYNLASCLLCPSDFVLKTFLEDGYPAKKLIRHQYGFDENIYYPNGRVSDQNRGLTMLFVGGCAPRKGLHYALQAWLESPASKDGTFLIAGEFLPAYAVKLSSMLSHPSVRVLGHRTDVPDLMRMSDLLILPSIEEGSALVTSEARGSGCVLLVSEAAGATCAHMKNALVHSAGDVDSLAEHISMVNSDRKLLERLRTESLSTAKEITWHAAGKRLFEIYMQVISD
jgi:glycosyltransferase involved in cell wall biosynthesis